MKIDSDNPIDGLVPIVSNEDTSTPFEGPEKLLEIWFAPSSPLTGQGLRAVPRSAWEDMLDVVKCKVLSVINGKEIDAYLLSESSLFVFPHKLILKTCGRTLNLLSLPHILAIAREYLPEPPAIHKLFYSRKSFMFPEHQPGVHRDWAMEVAYLDDLFAGGDMRLGKGCAYTVGRVNGDHWLLYMTGPGVTPDESPDDDLEEIDVPGHNEEGKERDYTLEILMSDLSPSSSESFFFPPALPSQNGDSALPSEVDPKQLGSKVSQKTHISSLFPAQLTNLDAWAFDPCGYSSNALIGTEGLGAGEGEGYYTIHVTPEEGYSYASFECNVQLSEDVPGGTSAHATNGNRHAGPHINGIDKHSTNECANGNGEVSHFNGDSHHSKPSLPSLRTLISRVVKIFNPGRLTVTAFMTSSPTASEVEAAQAAFLSTLGAGGGYKRTDKINYEFGGYDLAFATFERRGRGMVCNGRGPKAK